MTPLAAMVRANLMMSLRNRAALFWNLAFPALFIVIFGVVFGRGTTVQFDVGVAGPKTAFRDSLVTALGANPTFVVSVGDEANELQALEDGDRGVVAVLRSEAAGNAEGLPVVTLYYNATEGPVSQLAVASVRQAVIDVAGGPSPLPIEARPVTSQDVTFMDLFVPGILAMSLMNS